MEYLENAVTVRSDMGLFREIVKAESTIYTDKGGNEYLIHSGDITQIRPELECPATKVLGSLDALVQMVKTEALPMYSSTIYIMATNHVTAECFLTPDTGLRMNRLTLYDVIAGDIPGWNEAALGFEEALIAIRTRFQPTDDTEYMLKLLSEISNGAKVTFADNGIATTIVTQKGVALQEGVSIRPIVTLAPYRTFLEIEQPPSQFHIRISEKGIRFIEADGGMWKLTARKTIVGYLREHLSADIDSGRVVVML